MIITTSRRARLFVLAVASLFLLTACSDSSSVQSRFLFRIGGGTASIGPGLLDDTIVVAFDKDMDPVAVLDPAQYALESPVGSPITILGASLTYNAASRTLTVLLDGDGVSGPSANLPAGQSFVFRVVGNLTTTGGRGVDPAGSTVQGTVTGGMNPAPVIAGVSPGSAPTTGGKVITLTGTGFTSSLDTLVAFGSGSMPLLARVLDGGTATVVSPASDPRTAQVRMINSNGASRGGPLFRFDLPVPLFLASIVLPVGDEPTSATAVDFDGDGKVDVAVCSFTSSVIQVFRGQGDGRFDTPVVITLNTNAGPHTLRHGDFDNDGSPDLMVTKSSNGNFFVHLFQGVMDGRLQFSDGIRTRVGLSPQGFDIGDLDGDGNLDVVVANRNAGTLSFCLGDGTGEFPRVTTSSVDLLSPSDVALGDLDGDGDLDLATANLDDAGSTRVWIGDGSGGFVRSGSFPTSGMRSECIQLTDVTGDGFLDAVIANFVSNDVSILPGDGKGGFDDPMVIPTLAGPIELRVVDLDGDGWLDLAVAARNADSLAIHRGTGPCQFDSPEIHDAGKGPFDLVLSDIDGDGLTDLVSAVREGQGCSILLGVAAGQGSISEPVGDDPRRVVIGDFDGDGRPDLATADQGSASVSVLLNRGSGIFDRGIGPSVATSLTDVSAADFDGDGLDDLVVALPDVNRVSVYLSNGDGTFGDAIVTQIVMIPRPTFVYSGDLDADGFPDLMVVPLFPGSLILLLGNGDGTFTATGFAMAGSDPIQGVDLADFDHDGIVDIGFCQNVAQVGFAGYFIGNGDGTVRGFVNRDIREQPSDMAAGDMDGDGSPDVVIVGPELASGRNRARILVNDGTGQFPMGVDHVLIDLLFRPRSLKLVDMDGDGDLDLVTGNRATNTVSVVLMNRGNLASPQAILTFAVGDQPQDLGAVDLDGDGAIDVATVNSMGNSVSVLTNQR
jgi:hypothetical protein